MDTKTDEYLSPREVAEEIKVHITTVRRWIRTGKLPARRFGRHLRITRSDLVAFGKVTGREEAGHD